MLDKLRHYFNDLDADKSGAIGLSELEDPLITLEFCSSKQEVKNLIDTIDLDGSGEV
jgi:Ca2+-binding EF-hand superfamily protein